MSNARPSRPRYPLTPVQTPRQRRRFVRKVRTYQDVVVLQVLPHGGTGAPVRNPLLHNTTPPPRGSIATHVAWHCAPCRDHHRPRIHTTPRPAWFLGDPR